MHSALVCIYEYILSNVHINPCIQAYYIWIYTLLSRIHTTIHICSDFHTFNYTCILLISHHTSALLDLQACHYSVHTVYDIKFILWNFYQFLDFSHFWLWECNVNALMKNYSEIIVPNFHHLISLLGIKNASLYFRPKNQIHPFKLTSLTHKKNPISLAT